MKLIAAAALAALTLIPANEETWAENRTETLLEHLEDGRYLQDAGHLSAACNSYRHAELIVNQSYSDLKDLTPEFNFSELLAELKVYTSIC
jgi:hypothetical protein